MLDFLVFYCSMFVNLYITLKENYKWLIRIFYLPRNQLHRGIRTKFAIRYLMRFWMNF